MFEPAVIVVEPAVIVRRVFNKLQMFLGEPSDYEMSRLHLWNVCHRTASLLVGIEVGAEYCVDGAKGGPQGGLRLPTCCHDVLHLSRTPSWGHQK